MSENLITCTIDNKEFKYWTSISFNLSIDTISTFEFTAPFDPEKSALRDFFKPLAFKTIIIKIGNELFLTGTILNVIPSLADSSTVTVTGYSKPGALNDAHYGHDKNSLEFNNQTLEQISKEIAGYFGIDVRFHQLSGAPFGEVALETGQKPLSFLIDLAKKKGFLLTDDSEGRLIFHRAPGSGRQTDLKEGWTPLQSVTPQIDPQKYYSSVTAMTPGSLGGDFESVTVKNSFLSGINRPFIYKENQDLDPADLEKAVKWKAGLMFGSAISYSLSLQGLRDQFGQIWRPNEFINLLSPSAMVYKETKLLIKSVVLNHSESDSTTLNVVLPESYSGEIPKTLPWLE